MQSGFEQENGEATHSDISRTSSSTSWGSRSASLEKASRAGSSRAAEAHALGARLRTARLELTHSFLSSLARSDPLRFDAVGQAALSLRRALECLGMEVESAEGALVDPIPKPVLQSKPDTELERPHPGLVLAKALSQVTDICVRRIHVLAGAESDSETGSAKKAEEGIRARVFLRRTRRSTRSANSSNTALVALGGYGRSEVCPFSDIDVAVLHPGALVDIREFAAAIFYPLWDSGIKVGHSVWTPREAVALASPEVEVATSLLDARPVAGQLDLVADLESRIREFTERRASKLATAIVKSREKRVSELPRFDGLVLGGGSQTFDLKLGSGGLRDLHTISWLTTALGQYARDRIAPEEATKLEEARGSLLLVRAALHTWRKRREDVLDASAHAFIERAYGDAGASWVRDAHLASVVVEECVEELLSDLHYQRRLTRASVEIETREVPPRDRAESGEARQPRGLGQETRLDSGQDGKAALLEVLETRGGASLYTALRRLQTDGTLARVILYWDGLAGLRQRDPLHTFTADIHSMLAASRLEVALDQCLLDTHAMWPLGSVEALRRRLASTDGGRAQEEGKLSVPALLRMACLLHDLGKGRRNAALRQYASAFRHNAALDGSVEPFRKGPNDAGVAGAGPGREGAAGADVVGSPVDSRADIHAEVGAAMAKEACEALRLSPDDTTRLEFLVRNHLLLFECCTRRDPTDIATVEAVVSRVGDTDRLDDLFLLSLADASATGPQAWNSWRRQLLTRLYLSVRNELEASAEARDVPVGTARRPGRSTSQPARLTGRTGSPDLRSSTPTAATATRLIDYGVPAKLASLVAQSLPRSIEDGPPLDNELAFQALARYLAGSAVGISHESLGDGFWRIAAVAEDAPGLFARLAGTMALCSLSIDHAQAYCLDAPAPVGRVALDLFTVHGTWGGEISADTWKRFQKYVADAVEGKLAIRHRLARRIAESSRGVPAKETADTLGREESVEVRVDPEFSRSFTLVEVRAPDRLGLVFDLASTLAELRLDIVHASIETLGSVASDIFYITDQHGRKVSDPSHTQEIRDALRYAARRQY